MVTEKNLEVAQSFINLYWSNSELGLWQTANYHFSDCEVATLVGVPIEVHGLLSSHEMALCLSDSFLARSLFFLPISTLWFCRIYKNPTNTSWSLLCLRSVCVSITVGLLFRFSFFWSKLLFVISSKCTFVIFVFPPYTFYAATLSSF